MFRPEVDPLADTIPPRHAYESDEEDEFPPPPSRFPTGVNELLSKLDVIIVSGITQEKGTLIVASGEVGAVWAGGASLGRQVGQISIQATTIALVFQPAWTKSLVVISEPFSKLPVWGMHEYAQAILDYWKPSSVIIVDSYSTPTYITSEPIPRHLAPIRYLRTGSEHIQSLPGLQAFSPPNLLQSTTASFLSILSLPPWAGSSGIAILVPSSRASKVPPHDFTPNISVGLDTMEQSEEWDSSLLQDAHSIVQTLSLVTEKVEWQPRMGSKTAKKGRRQVSDLEGSMYI